MICIRCITADNPERQCQQAGPNEQRQEQSCVWVELHSHSPSRLSFTPRPLRPTAHTLLCPPAPALTCVCQWLVCRASAADRQVHKFTPCSVSLFTSAYMWLQGLLVPTPLSVQPSAESGEEGRKRGRQNRLEHFSGVLSFFIWSARSCWTTNQKCAKEKGKTTEHRQELLHSTLHKEKSHPRAKPATFLGPLTLFWVSLSLCGLWCGISTWNRDGSVFTDCSARASFSNTMSSRQIWQAEPRRQHIEVN